MRRQPCLSRPSQTGRQCSNRSLAEMARDVSAGALAVSGRCRDAAPDGTRPGPRVWPPAMVAARPQAMCPPGRKTSRAARLLAKFKSLLCPGRATQVVTPRATWPMAKKVPVPGPKNPSVEAHAEPVSANTAGLMAAGVWLLQVRDRGEKRKYRGDPMRERRHQPGEQPRIQVLDRQRPRGGPGEGADRGDGGAGRHLESHPAGQNGGSRCPLRRPPGV